VTAEIGGFTIAKGGSPGNEGGGGIYNHGTLKLTNSTVSGNTEYSGGGGGIDNHGTLTLTNSTVSDNLAASNGGGINNRRDGGVTTLINSTVSGNTGEYYGGGINNVGTLTLTSSTVSGNTASIFGNIYNGDTATLTNTVIDGDCWGDITSNGYNIESPGDTCGFDQTGDLVNITEGQLDLGELANNGGPTMTHALGADSVAIDHIPAVDCEVDKDQRDQPRPETGGTMCDVGSVEVQP